MYFSFVCFAYPYLWAKVPTIAYQRLLSLLFPHSKKKNCRMPANTARDEPLFERFWDAFSQF
jgi:hypothetical protein